MKQERCPICGSDNVAIFFQWRNAVVSQQTLMPTEEQARQVTRGDIELAFCRSCGLIWNVVFDHHLVEYSTSYEASQTRSLIFQEYVGNIARYLVCKYDIRSKEILEIGCGDGFFLRLLCQLGQNRGTGFDLGWRGDDEENVSENVTCIRANYSEKYANYQGDLVCCRHVLEHIPNPVEFLKELAHLTQLRQPVFFFELPNVSWSLRQSAFWDIYYEHCLYFSRASLRYLFTLCGFDVLGMREGFGGQYVLMEGRFHPQPRELHRGGALKQVQELSREVEIFSTSYREIIENWRKEIDTAISKQYRVVIWGAGAKAVSFVNMLNLQPDQIEIVVDINPKKKGTYVPGMGQKIVAPEFLAQDMPDVILVMNPEYLSEIHGMINDMGIRAKLRAIDAPAQRLY